MTKKITDPNKMITWIRDNWGKLKRSGQLEEALNKWIKSGGYDGDLPADDIIFIGEATAFLYQEYNTKNNFRVINYGAKALSTNSSEAKGNGKLVLLHVGSIERRKGQDILIQSISQLPRDYLDNLEVYIVGRILEYEFYKRITKLSRSFKNIHFVKEVSHDVIGTFMGRAHIFVCSSRDEVGPLTVLEAMSAGKAIISTDVGGVSVMIRNHEDGIIIQKDNSKALTDSIIYLYNNRQEIQRLGENAQRRFNEHFTLDKFGDSVLNIVNERLK